MPKTKKTDSEKNQIEAGTLYLVSTPIGNLADLSDRAKKILSEVDFVAAEDTRNSGLLLSRIGIHRPMVSYYEHNKRERGEEIAARLEAGESCALVTDAGTPAISDPGEDLVALCAARNIPVRPIPGPVASIAALTVSGLPTGRFCFEGFLPTVKAERRERLESLRGETRTVLFHEAPHKLLRTLEDLAEAFGPDRRIALCRELTKLNEEVFRTTLGEAAAYYREHEPRGEFVLVVEGAAHPSAASAFWTDLEIPEHVAVYEGQGMSRMDAIKRVARDRGVQKSEIYGKMVSEKEGKKP